jgi:hypothetical protein
VLIFRAIVKPESVEVIVNRSIYKPGAKTFHSAVALKV